MVDQLLLMARFENQKMAITLQKINLDEVVLQALERYSPKIEARKIDVDFTFHKHFEITSDAGMATLIIENIIIERYKIF